MEHPIQGQDNVGFPWLSLRRDSHVEKCTVQETSNVSHWHAKKEAGRGAGVPGRLPKKELTEP